MPVILEDLSRARDLTRGFPIVLVTGGSGYIGSHTVLEILKTGCAVVVLDNLVNSHLEALTRVYHIAQAELLGLGGQLKECPPLIFHQIDLCDRKNVCRLFHFWQSSDKVELFNTPNFNIKIISETLKGRTFKMRDYDLSKDYQPEPLSKPQDSNVLENGRITAVVHFAALKAVGESVSKPLQYYRNNIGGLLNLLEAMSRFKVNRIVFSSSAVVYGSGKEANITEDAVQVGGKGSGGGLVTNPYGRSKWMAEEILNDFCIANRAFECISLRYFNPTGSHPSGLIGEDPKGIPNNIVPVILQTYQRRRSKVYVFGSNYDTSDGTGVRDYIHVEDLARGHLAALRSMLKPVAERIKQSIGSVEPPSVTTEGGQPTEAFVENYRVYNLGTGQGYSVLDIINAFAKACDAEIPFSISEARAGDLGTVTANASKAATELGWQAQFGIQDMCRDVYTFASENPQGYERLRRLSRLASQDPTIMKKVSVAAGLVPQKSNNKDVASMMQSYLKLSQSPEAFSDMVRQMSVYNPAIQHEMRGERRDSQNSLDSGINTFGMSPQWSVFGDVSWEDDELSQSYPSHLRHESPCRGVTAR